MSAIVIGAGISGLAAAAELSAAGMETIVLEGRDRIGGRIHTIYDDRFAAPIELGAEFVHGTPPEILGLAKSAGLLIAKTRGNSWYRKENSDLSLAEDDPPGSNDRLWDIADSYIRSDKPDISFEDFLHLPQAGGVSDREKEWAKRFVSGFHAAEPQKVGIYGLVKTQNAEASVNGMISQRISQGYSQLCRFLEVESKSDGAKLLLNNLVTSVEGAESPVRIRAKSPDGDDFFYEASAAIVTLPVGVLKNTPDSPYYLKFIPEIEVKRSLLDRIHMGCARRVSLVFEEKWWMDELKKVDASKSELGFLFGQNVPVSVWWANEPSESAVLTGWVGGPKAVEMEMLGDAQFVDLAITSLKRIFGKGESMLEAQLIDGFTHDWRKDPFSGGAYTYTGVGGASAPCRLADPLENRLYFAGEATSDGHWGTVHGAIESGIRAAREVLAAHRP